MKVHEEGKRKISVATKKQFSRNLKQAEEKGRRRETDTTIEEVWARRRGGRLTRDRKQ